MDDQDGSSLSKKARLCVSTADGGMESARLERTSPGSSPMAPDIEDIDATEHKDTILNRILKAKLHAATSRLQVCAMDRFRLAKRALARATSSQMKMRLQPAWAQVQ